MGKKINWFPYVRGNRHGRISFGSYRESNERAGVLLQSGRDAGRHYTVMQNTGDADNGSKGSTTSICPGTHTVKAGKDIVNYTLPSKTHNHIPAIFYEEENGDIVLTVPHGNVKISAENIELIATGVNNKNGVISLTSNEKINLKSQMIDLNSGVSTKIFSESTIDIIGKGILNVYAGLADFADQTTKDLGRYASKLSDDNSVVSKNEVQNSALYDEPKQQEENSQ